MSSPKIRVVAVDVLRLIATVQMIQGHTLDAVWAADASRLGFQLWSWLRGLTSVAFLFAAGLSYWLAALSAPPDRLRAGRRRRVRRGIQLVVVGYLMHLPAGAASFAEAFRLATVVDILQCIGVTLLALEGMSAVARRPAHVAASAGALAVALYALAPSTRSLSTEGALAPLVAYVSTTTGSIFPLVPYAGAMLAGVVVGIVAFPARAATPTRFVVTRLLASSASVFAAAAAASTWDAEVSQALVKLAVVVLVTGALALGLRSVSRLPVAFETLAGETLVMYVAHVVLLYASFVGLGTLVGKTQPLSSALVVAVAMIAAMGALGLGWHAAKARLAGGAGTGYVRPWRRSPDPNGPIPRKPSKRSSGPR